jgi:hypothetical protein
MVDYNLVAALRLRQVIVHPGAPPVVDRSNKAFNVFRSSLENGLL